MSDLGNIPEDYRYTKDHEWVKRDDNDHSVVLIGITDFAQHALGDVVHVEIPEVGTHYEVGDELGVVESAKSASEIYVPLCGKIIEVNCNLDSHPEYINNSPYEDGWIVKLLMDDPDDLDDLLSPDGYGHYLEEEES